MSVIGPRWKRIEDVELARAERRLEAEGLCVRGEQHPDEWFPSISSRPRDAKGQRRSLGEASRQCSSEQFGPCPVRELCAETAIARGELHGIWGGLPAWVLRQLRRNPRPLLAMFRAADAAAAEMAAAERAAEAAETEHNTTTDSHPRLAA